MDTFIHLMAFIGASFCVALLLAILPGAYKFITRYPLMKKMDRSNKAREEFEQWWQKYGQFCRHGGGEYEKYFAYAAWMHLSGVKP